MQEQFAEKDALGSNPHLAGTDVRHRHMKEPLCV